MKNVQNDFIDRDLSWLDFNTRVLELAENQKLPLLERVKFLAIYSSNLDEFFMVRVASLKRKIEYGNTERLISGLTPRELLGAIHTKVRILQERVSYLLINDLKPRLSEEGIKRVSWDSLSDTEKAPLTEKFVHEIFPVLTPLASDPAHPFPHISGLSLNLGIIGRNTKDGEEQFVRVKVPSNVSRMVRINDSDFSYILLEDLIAEHLHLLLPGARIEEIYFFRVTRNQDLDIDEDDAEDLLESLEEELSRRKFGAAVRMEVEQGVAPRLLEKLTEELEISTPEVFIHKPPLDLTYLFEMSGIDMPHLKDHPFRSVQPHQFEDIDRHDADSFFSAIRDGEILLHHPYQTFTSTVTRFVELAAQDPKVLAIKQTLYRTSGDSQIMKSLIEAAKAGKQVLAVIELRARFDEQANVRWAKKLEDAGAHVVYGVLGLKTHAKASLVVRKEEHGLTVYSHIGTGNYNPKTARIYDDLGVMSSDQTLGQDLLTLFNHLSGVHSESQYSRLLVAPHGIRNSLLEKINRERKNHLDGKPSQIRWKVNSLVDNEMIEALYAAAKDGVPIELLVRGACSFRMSKVAKFRNVRVRSILGRFLEHSRIYNFHNAGSPEYFIGSADIMERNLDRRVEALIRVDKEEHQNELKTILELSISPRFRMWEMQEDDSWHYIKNGPEGKPLEDFQEYFIERYKK
ncbi:Ppk Polyphosphate kinase [Candidatus Nanopelagicaceae bacterium]